MREEPKVPRDEILLALGEIKGQLDGFIKSQEAQDKRMDAHDQRLNQLSERISRLERAKSWLLGAAAVVGSGLSFAFNRLLT